jgi:hypothetical protein
LVKMILLRLSTHLAASKFYRKDEKYRLGSRPLDAASSRGSDQNGRSQRRSLQRNPSFLRFGYFQAQVSRKWKPARAIEEFGSFVPTNSLQFPRKETRAGMFFRNHNVCR